MGISQTDPWEPTCKLGPRVTQDSPKVTRQTPGEPACEPGFSPRAPSCLLRSEGDRASPHFTDGESEPLGLRAGCRVASKLARRARWAAWAGPAILLVTSRCSAQRAWQCPGHLCHLSGSLGSFHGCLGGPWVTAEHRGHHGVLTPSTGFSKQQNHK